MENGDKIYCHVCKSEQLVDYKFCVSCGAKNLSFFKDKVTADNDYSDNLRMLSIYSAIIVVALIINLIFGTTVEFFVGLTIAFAIIDLIFAFAQPIVWNSVFRPVNPKPLFWIVPSFVASGIIISILVDNINFLLFDEQALSGYTFLFIDTTYPLLYSIIFVGVFPAIFEELAFRGFLFNNLKKIAGINSAIWGSAFLFALMHFSLIGIIWIFPFGLILAQIRKHHSTILYGVAAHFIHNTTVVAIEYFFGSLVL
ncbi:type II CAAX endopeptidase family protein [Ekhidna sp.]|jgi:membrane protease YdiL (CAAX protease family)|uniref:CPBP family intramembrane glutamic endopeptidase n=1 Tax=Ekhidna sp. TaxID=2608089 RepID=UPI0032EE9504